MANTTHGMTIHSVNRVEESYIDRCVAARIGNSPNADELIRNLCATDMAIYNSHVGAAYAQKMVDSVRKDAETAHNILARQLCEV